MSKIDGRSREAERERLRRWRHENPEKVREHLLAWKQKSQARYIFQRSKRRAARDSIAFLLTEEWVAVRLATGVCELTGIAFELEGPWAPSIDRKSSNEGYTFENCRLVVWIYNMAKSTWDDDIVLRMAQALTGVNNAKSIQSNAG